MPGSGCSYPVLVLLVVSYPILLIAGRDSGSIPVTIFGVIFTPTVTAPVRETILKAPIFAKPAQRLFLSAPGTRFSFHLHGYILVIKVAQYFTLRSGFFNTTVKLYP